MMRFAIRLLLALILGLLPTATALARVVDGIAPQSPVLAKLVEMLDSRGLDIRNNGGHSEQIPVRPQVAELRTFPASRLVAGSADPFETNFRAGLASDRAYLVAIDAPGTPQPSSDQEFRALWDRAPREARIFVSFSGKDIDQAEALKAALRASGHVVFIYKNGGAGTVTVNAVETGQYFRSAGHHLVIDTRSARESRAVHAEALALRRSSRIVVPPPLITPDRSQPCCQLCRYRNGIQISCEPPKCGFFECAGARPPPF